MTVLAIDPGPQQSAYVLWDGAKVVGAKVPNADLLSAMRSAFEVRTCVCERIRSFGMPAGAELFETCEWVGRFWQAWVSLGLRQEWHFVTRQDVKLHLCMDSKAKDGNIRQAIIDRFGGKDKAIGTKKSPGPLHGVSGDVWSALAVALTWHDKHADGRLPRTA